MYGVEIFYENYKKTLSETLAKVKNVNHLLFRKIINYTDKKEWQLDRILENNDYEKAKDFIKKMTKHLENYTKK